MALPAGYSSDEDSDFEGLSYCSYQSLKVNEKETNQVDDNVSEGQKLIIAVKQQQFEVVKALVESGADPNFKPENNGWSPLMHAASLGDVKLVELLLRKGADPNIQIKLITPLLSLCDSNFSSDEEQLVHCFNLLIDAGAKAKVFNLHGETPLMCASARGYHQLVSRLLDIDDSINFPNVDGWTAIFYAVNKGHEKIVNLLKDAGSDLTLLDGKGQSLYDIANYNNNERICKIVSIDSYEPIHDATILNKTSNYQLVKSEMPNYKISCFNGFYEDFQKTLQGVGMKNVVTLLADKGIGYGQFLVNTDQDWEKLGVNMSFDRKKMVIFARDIIENSWSKDAFVDFGKEDFTLFTAAQKLCNIVRVVHILIATCYVCRRELQSQDIEALQEIRDHLNEALEEIIIFRISIERVKNLLLKIDNASAKYPADFIKPPTNSSQNIFRLFYRYRWFSCVLISFLGLHLTFKQPSTWLKKLLISSYLRIMS